MKCLGVALGLIAMVMVGVLGAPLTVSAEEQGAPQASEEASEQGGTPEASPQRSGLPEAERRMPGGNLVIVTYLILWAMVTALLIQLWRRQRGLQEEIEELEDRLDRWTEVDG